MNTTADGFYNKDILYIDFEKANFEGCQTNLTVSTPYFYYVNDPATFFIMPPDQNWGAKDIFIKNIDNNTFENYWNDYTRVWDIMTGYLNDSSMTNFYQVIDQVPNVSRVIVNLAIYENYPPSANCIQNLLFSKNDYDFIGYTNDVLMPNYEENILTFIIWDCLSIFMAVYSSIFIRMRFIIMTLKNEARPADKRDENIQKLSFKILQSFVFLIKVIALSNIIKDFTRIIRISNELVNNNCYNVQIINDSLNYAVLNLKNTLNFYTTSFYMLLTVFFFEFMNLIFYIKLWYGKYSDYVEKKREAEELKKEQELIQLAFHNEKMTMSKKHD